MKRAHGGQGESAVIATEDKETRDAVHAQLQRLLSHALFSQSRRYSTLLRYVVEKTLDGEGEFLKERTLGIEVFGREPGYDTGADPVVRTTAAQLRRRLAQYYFTAARETETVIDLPAGGYAVTFRVPVLPSAALISAPRDGELELAGLAEIEPSRQLRASGPRGYSAAVAIAAAIVVLLAAAFFLIPKSFHETALHKFWRPAFDTPGSILICVGIHRSSAQTEGGQASGAPGPTIRQYLAANNIAWPDAITFSSLVGLLQANGRDYRLKKSTATGFSDLRDSAAILIGGYNNQWIMNLGAPLRFHYAKGGRIEDSQNPSQRSWATDFEAPFSTFNEDYGIISRLIDPGTGRVLVIASGIAAYGTIAAGEFLTSEKHMQAVASHAPKGWEHQNLQIVFKTQVVNGNSGPPRILATYFWK